VGRYASVLVASACLQVWRQASGRDPFLGDPMWLRAMWDRLSALSGRRPGPLPDHIEERLFAELLSRHEELRCFGLSNRRFAG
jgi:hypothetical protein